MVFILNKNLLLKKEKEKEKHTSIGSTKSSFISTIRLNSANTGLFNGEGFNEKLSNTMVFALVEPQFLPVWDTTHEIFYKL